MMNVLQQLLARPAVRYLVVGGSVYLLELALILLGQRAGLGAVWAVTVAFIVGTLVSFALQKLFTFGDKRLQHRIVGVQLALTVGLVLFNLGFTVAATALLQQLLPAVVIRTMALAVTTLWNFYLYKTRIFKQNVTPAAAE